MEERFNFIENCDFSGWATRINKLCSDGRVIRDNAFAHCDGEVVPIVWNHRHDDSYYVLGKALLENRPGEGVFAYGKFNDTDSGVNAKKLVAHGDIHSLSICANQLKMEGNNVMHGTIREVSLVLAGANPYAHIEHVMKHSDIADDEMYLCFGDPIDICHSDDEESEDVIEHKEEEQEDMASTEKTIKDVFDTFTEEQKKVVYALVGAAIEEATGEADDEEDTEDMKHNVFDSMEDRRDDDVLLHSMEMDVIADAKRFGTMKESFLQHAETYGIDNIDYLFPDDKNVTNEPIFIKRKTDWVSRVMNGVHHTPFSRIKSLFADITEEEARAKGYIKGNMKKEEVFSLLKRSTTPTTVYKKQKMDRDDVVDITDFNVVSWLKTEMRSMLDEELARAFLIGDGRLASSDDKIDETHIRPIWKDENLFTIKAPFKVRSAATSDDKAKAFIHACIRAKKDYKGSGNPVLFTTEDVLTDCMLMTDTIGRDLYDSMDKLAKKIGVTDIITVPVMEGLTREDSGTTYQLYGIIVNLNDYNVGADKGGSINMFEDFDIDYNQQKYLIETRCSGALIKPYSAIAVELDTTNHIS